jgi:hypothetical protein
VPEAPWRGLRRCRAVLDRPPFGASRTRASVTARAWSVASLAALLLAFAATAGYGYGYGPPTAGLSAEHTSLPTAGLSAGTANTPVCHGSFRRVRPRHVSFSFSCENEDVTGFALQANRALHSVYDPVFAFGCERRTARSFDCEDIHSGAGSVGSGLATVTEPLCHGGPHLVLRVTPFLNFEDRPRPIFTLKGPC